MDIICPVLLSRDSERFVLLYDTLEKFCHDNYRLILVSPEGDTPIKNKKIIPIKEGSLDNSLKHRGKGWWKQQLIKLLSHKVCDTDFILSLDADCLAVKPFVFNDFLQDGKVITKVSPYGSWPNWYNGSSSILNLPFNYTNQKVGVTPFIFSREILKGLSMFLEALYTKNFGQYLLDNTDLSNKPNLMPGATWSEYCLYHVYGVQSAMWNYYHHNNANFELYGNCFWIESEADLWIPEKSFLNPRFYFTVCQSIANKDAKWVRDKVRDFIQ